MTDDIAVPRDWKRTAIIVAGCVIALNLFIAGALATRNTTHTSDLPEGIEYLLPPRDQVVRAQDQIGIQLTLGYKGELTLDGRALPADQYDRNGIDLGTIVWRPGIGKEFRELPPGRHTLTARYWPVEQGPGGDQERIFTWTFKSA